MPSDNRPAARGSGLYSSLLEFTRVYSSLPRTRVYEFTRVYSSLGTFEMTAHVVFSSKAVVGQRGGEISDPAASDRDLARSRARSRAGCCATRYAHTTPLSVLECSPNILGSLNTA